MEQDEGDEAPIGNIIMLYNKVFVPTMKEYLLKSPALNRCANYVKDSLQEIESSSRTNNENTGNLCSPAAHLKRIQERSLGRMDGTQTLIEFGKVQPAAVRQANEVAMSSHQVQADQKSNAERPSDS